MFTASKKNYDLIIKSVSQDAEKFKRLAALNRINCLSAVKSASHGWIGASFSICEILTFLYFFLNEKNIVLSKGHAAPMQYSCLLGKGVISEKDILNYKNGLSAPQAHTDIRTKGILVNSGSLGQGLSKSAGLAFYDKKNSYYVILGDGELQEGQNFEAFQTIARYNLKNLITVVDENKFQSDSKVKSIKGIKNLKSVFEGLGFAVRKINGHCFQDIKKALKTKSLKKPLVILARTFKGGINSYTKTPYNTPDGKAVWHSKVPDNGTYLRIIKEEINKNVSFLKKKFEDYKKNLRAKDEKKGKIILSTGDYFAAALEKYMASNKKITVLDADLAKSCRLDKIRGKYKKLFIEIGISEQDMVSFAGGLALKGYIPVVNTYASFYKRCYEQVFVNLTENKKTIYAGHYSGIDYHTDGKTHQSLNDLNFMRALPGLTIIEPFDKKTTEYYLKWAINKSKKSVYFKLRRTGFNLKLNYKIQGLNPVFIKGKNTEIFWAAGPLAAKTALYYLKKNGNASLVIQTVYDNEPDLDYFSKIFKNVSKITVVEDNFENGGLKDYALDILNKINRKIPLKAVNIKQTGWSFRNLKDCLDYFDFKL